MKNNKHSWLHFALCFSRRLESLYCLHLQMSMGNRCGIKKWVILFHRYKNAIMQNWKRSSFDKIVDKLPFVLLRWLLAFVSCSLRSRMDTNEYVDLVYIEACAIWQHIYYITFIWEYVSYIIFYLLNCTSNAPLVIGLKI